MHPLPAPSMLIDGLGRRISYVRLSITDRCDFRCRYCMPEKMTFLPRSELLSIEELVELGDILIARGVSRIRLTGGEPLVRRGVVELVHGLGSRLGDGLEELTMTTNGSQLVWVAGRLSDAGIRRINVSLDSLNEDRFREITRGGDLGQVVGGISAARKAGIAIKINMVALKGYNECEFAPMLSWCGDHGYDLTLIETMPLGEIEGDRAERYLPLDEVMNSLQEQFKLVPTLHRTGGPARYFDVVETGGRLGLITPLTNNFCAGCNRIRITATGTVFGCLGHDQNVELRDLLREGGKAAVDAALDELVAGKPDRHGFDIGKATPAVQRHMSVTGG